jgi:hypothetical protein
MPQGFQSRIPSKSQITAIRTHFTSLVRGWRTQKLKVVFAYLNALTYRACCSTGIVTKVRRAQGEAKGFHRVASNIRELALKGIGQFNVTIEGVADQIGAFWQIKISEASLRKYRYELRDTFKLFRFKSLPLPKGCKGDANARRPPALLGFNLPLACVLLEVLEEVLVGERGCELDDFPGKGAMGKLVYDALFRGIASYRRKEAQQDVVVMTTGESVVYASEVDWHGYSLNERGIVAWYGLTLIPDDAGVLPELSSDW